MYTYKPLTDAYGLLYLVRVGEFRPSFGIQGNPKPFIRQTLILYISLTQSMSLCIN